MKAYTEFVDFIVQGLSPQQILAFRPSDETRERVRYLLTAEKTGTISADETTELNEFEQFEHLMRMTKARASQHGARG
ncbi:hypothetical protein [Spirosoma pollinicola]|uniref:Uncharacterized protein n=1 Tax=Spirosoma pollinicola TaxID=2057025 RepID=A0A2K8Z1V7_9BACT|nr:hypothetical protein [Spirosoma pollinicola]AUD03867.1 hypothetical protein CWM47_19785 [Spirosoma pollinicola]